MRALLPLLLLTALVAGCGKSPFTTARVVTSATVRTDDYDPTRVIVKYHADRAGLGLVAGRLGLTSARELPALSVTVFAAKPGSSAGNALQTLKADARVDYAEPDYVLDLDDARPTQGPSLRKLLGLQDPLENSQWGLAKIEAPAAWQVTTGSPDVIVAVLDTGVDLDHPDLRNALVPGTTMFPEQGGPSDQFGHGTHVSGIIAAQLGNGIGGAGVAPGCKIMPVKVMGPTGSKGTVENIAAGLVWATDHGAKIVNMSLGDEGTSDLLRDAVRYAESKDVLIVAAAGNFDPDKNKTTHTLDYPAGYPGVMAVGATDEQDQLADFSFWGSWLSVVAPGVDIYSSVPGTQSQDDNAGNYEYEDGTSMATPYVAGVAALIRTRFPNLTAPQVKARIENTAIDLGAPGYDDHFGHGRIDAFRAVSGS